jgi:[ribosomal protein S5]-alanine N-acetyltransferase
MILESERLIIRPFEKGDDQSAIRRVLGQDFGHSTVENASVGNLQSWLRWQMLNDEWFPRMLQPPYGDRAIILKSNGRLIGAVGYVPCLAPFAQIPELKNTQTTTGGFTPELGLFYAVDPEYQGRGYATEAARAMIEHAFNRVHVERVVAMTDYSNTASQKVMQKLGMTIARNPTTQPHWLQVVGVLYNQNPS